MGCLKTGCASRSPSAIPAASGPRSRDRSSRRGALSGADLYVVGAYAALSSWLARRRRAGPPARFRSRKRRRSRRPIRFPYIDTGEETAYRLGSPTAASGRASGPRDRSRRRSRETRARRGHRHGARLQGGARHGRLRREKPHLHARASLRRSRLPDDDGLGRPAHRDSHEGHPPQGRALGGDGGEDRGGRARHRELAPGALGIERPRIAVAALNPHAGDGGVIGTEERDTILPVLEALRGGGHLVEGPFSADTLFYNWADKGYDAFVALYHDQGMIPFKVSGFEGAST